MSATRSPPWPVSGPGWWFLRFLVLSLIGALLDRLVFRPLEDEDPIVTMLVTFGLLLVLEDAVRTIWGKEFSVHCSRHLHCPGWCC